MTNRFRECLLAAALASCLAGCDAGKDSDVTAGAAAPTEAAADPADAPTDGGVSVETPDDAADEGHAAHWDGFGPATFGMTADEVRTAWDGDLGDIPEEAPECFHLSPTAQPDYAYFAMMFGDSRFVRYSASNDAMVAPGGGRRGMSATEVDVLYPDAVVRQPHKYTDGEYLRIEGHGDTVLVFETDEDGTVTEWRVGVPPYVDYVEGCS